MIPPGNGQGMQVLRYSQGQGYKPHFDYFFNKDGISNGGNRLATVLMFLESAEEGGETVFPNLPRPPTQTLANGWSECSMQGHAIKPKRGDAIVFWSLKTDGTLDPGTLHGTCPTSASSANPLWTSTKWFNVGHYVEEGSTEKAVEVQHVIYAPPPPPAPPGCMDTNESCAGWASVGECDKNPGFMVGSKQSPGACLLSCAHCDFMPLHSPDAGKSPIAITKNNGTHEQQQHQEEGAP
jgi:prolyl 4-hydroxylase